MSLTRYEIAAAESNQHRLGALTLLQRLARLLRPYRPYKHYMRGRGPKCREKEMAARGRDERGGSGEGWLHSQSKSMARKP
jgi:hypothetical protein